MHGIHAYSHMDTHNISLRVLPVPRASSKQADKEISREDNLNVIRSSNQGKVSLLIGVVANQVRGICMIM